MAAKFAIHISSCLVQIERAGFLKRVLNDFLLRFKGHPIYVGFDIAGLDHSNGESLRELFTTNANLHAFHHLDGLGYSWNHPWKLHDYNIVFQTEDDWIIPNLSIEMAEEACKFLEENEGVMAVAAPERTGSIWEKHEGSKYLKSKIIDESSVVKYLVNNHPHFETRQYRSIIGPFVENTPPPKVEFSYYMQANKEDKRINIWSMNLTELHIGNISSNHPCAWANFLTSPNTPNINNIQEICQLICKEEGLDIIIKKNEESIYDLLRKRHEKMAPVIFPSPYLYEVARFREGSEFLALFFNHVVAVTNDKCVDVLKDIEDLKMPFKIQKKVADNLILLEKNLKI
jgi:hypothetical protein